MCKLFESLLNSRHKCNYSTEWLHQKEKRWDWESIGKHWGKYMKYDIVYCTTKYHVQMCNFMGRMSYYVQVYEDKYPPMFKYMGP